MKTLRFSFLVTAVLAFLAVPLAADGPPWVPLGPGGGSVVSLAVHPANPNVVYAATAAAPYRSVNGGATWVEIPGIGGTLEVALDPSRPTTVYALTRRRLFKSVDGGATWTSSVPGGLPPSGPLSHLAIDPAQPSRLYVSGVGRVLRSDNGGASWRQVSQGLPFITGLAVPRRPSGTVFAATRSGLYRTTNAGRTWTPLGRGLPAESVSALAVSPSDPQQVYVSLESGFYRSQDGGTRWTQAAGPEDQPMTVLTVHPRVARTLFAMGRRGMVKSVNSGRDWTLFGPRPGGFVAESIAVHSGPSGDTLYMGVLPQGLDTGGVIVSTDGGAHWTVRNRGLHELAADEVGADAEGALLAGLRGQGLFRRTNPRFPPTWTRTHAGAPFQSEFVSVGNIVNAGPGLFFAPVISTLPTTNPLWRTTDGGRTWSVVPVPGLEGPFNLTADPQEEGTVYVWNHRNLVRTQDGGESWTPLPLPQFVCGFRNLAVAPSSPPGARVLYAAGSGGINSACQVPLPQVLRSSDGGASWVEVGTGTPLPSGAGAFPGHLAVDPLDANVVYVSLSGISIPGPFGLWKSVDGGANWTATGAPFAPVLGLVVPPVPGRVYAAVAVGLDRVHRILRSDDGGATWSPWDEGINANEITDLTLDPGDPRRLYAATSRGVWVLEEED